MRYWNDWYTVQASLREGAIIVHDEQDIMGSAVQSPILEPSIIGKMVYTAAMPKPSIYLGDSEVESDVWEKRARVAGSSGRLNYVRTTARVYVCSDGYETRLRLEQPDKDGWGDYVDIPRLSARLPKEEWRNEPQEFVDASKAEHRLLIPPWRDPEMLGQAILSLLNMAGPPFSKETDSVFSPPRPKRRVVLHKAAIAGDPDGLPKMSRGGGVDPADSEGSTPLMLAAAHGHGRVVERLLEMGADPTLQDRRGWSALHHAAASGNVESIAALLGTNVDQLRTDEIGRTPLHIAASLGWTGAAQLLLTNGAAPNIADSAYRSTPLHIAARGGHATLVPILVAAGAKLDAGNERGRSPLHVAVAYGQTDMAKALIDAGADVNARDNEGEAPLLRAAFFQHMDCIVLLVGHGADPRATDIQGNTPLHVAASMNRDDVVRWLVEAGADVERENVAGLTPLDCALVNAHFAGSAFFRYEEHNAEAAEALVENGATLDPLRLGIGDRHALWPQLTPPNLLRPTGDIDDTQLPELPESVRGALRKVHANGWTPYLVSMAIRDSQTLLHDAVTKGMTELSHRLLRGGVSPITAVRNSLTPLHVAASTGNEPAAALLLEWGADLEMPSFNSRDQLYDLFGAGRYGVGQETPLDYAIHRGHTEMVRFLLQRDAVPPVSRADLAAGNFEAQPNQNGEVHRGSAQHPLSRCTEDKEEAIIAVFAEFGLEI